MDAAQRVLRSRLGGYATAARYDAREINAKARATYRDSFRSGHGCLLCQPFVMPAGLSEAEVDRRATALRRQHYTRLSIRSASSRAARNEKAAPAIVSPGAATEASGGSRRRPTAS